MKVKKIIIIYSTCLFLSASNIFADTVEFNLRGSSYEVAFILNGPSIDSNSTTYYSNNLTDFNALFNFDYGSGSHSFTVNNGSYFNLRENRHEDNIYPINDNMSLDLTHSVTGDSWAFFANNYPALGNVYDENWQLSKLTEPGEYYEDWYIPMYWEKTVVPIPPAIFLFLSGLSVLSIKMHRKRRN